MTNVLFTFRRFLRKERKINIHKNENLPKAGREMKENANTGITEEIRTHFLYNFMHS